MSSPTTPDAVRRPDGPSILLERASVRYKLPEERMRSFKEYAIRRLKRSLAMREHWGLREVSLEAWPGEVLGIVGRNGAGKTTLLKVVSRVLKPTGGRVVTRGLVAPLLSLGAGFIFDLSGRENVYLSGATLGFSYRDVRRRFDRILEFADIGRFIDAPLRTYSSGMVARLAFAIATDVDPDILILDEIMAVGDAEFREKSSRRIQEIQSRGATVLLVSHSTESLAPLVDRVLWLEQGRMRACGLPEEILEAYETEVGGGGAGRPRPARWADPTV